MADREFVFGRADVQKLLRERFVVAAADDWYQRRQNDALGKFFRSVADQGPRKGAGGGTRQGRYAFTASGKFLGFNNNRDPQRILKMLHDSLAKFEKLPAADRTPGALQIPVLKPADLDRRYARIPPEGGLIVKVHARVLTMDGKSGLYKACGDPGANTATYRHKGFGAATDHLWITEDETKALVKSLRGHRDGADLSKAIAMRVAKFHLVDNTRGEPPHWKKEEIREMTLHAVPAKGEGEWRLTGNFHLETPSGDRGYEGLLEGILQIDQASDTVTRFDFVAIGKHWGQGRYTPGARPGKSPLGVAFTLGDPRKPEDRIPPQGIRWEDGYYHAERH